MSKFRLNSPKSLAERKIKLQISEDGKYFHSNHFQVKFCDLFVQSVIQLKKKKKKKRKGKRNQETNTQFWWNEIFSFIQGFGMIHFLVSFRQRKPQKILP